MKKKQEVRPHTFGLSLLLVVFLVLCLMTFAAISISEARNDLMGSKKKYEKTRALNDAENLAEQAVRDETRRANEKPQEAKDVVEFSVSIDDTDELDVRLELLPPDDEGKLLYRVTRWQVVSNADWVPENLLEVLPDGQIGW